MEKFRAYLDNLKKDTARLDSVRSELKIANTIQKSLFPKLTKDFLKEEFSLETFYQPAKEIGGDLYDFFYLDEAKEQLALVLGDVTGKGIPAALFMGVIKTTIRNFCQSFKLLTPGKVLAKVNSEICANNSEDMFASIFLIYYEIRTGIMTFANAGHNPSVLIDSKNKKIIQFGSNGESLIGVFKESAYKTNLLQLQKDDRIISYSDGVTDATSPDGQIYGKNRLIKSIESNLEKTVPEMIKIISDAVVGFQKGDLFDDITLMSLQRKI